MDELSKEYLTKKFIEACEKGVVKYFPKILKIIEIPPFKILVVPPGMIKKREQRPKRNVDEILKKWQREIVLTIQNKREWGIVPNQYSFLPFHFLIVPLKKGRVERKPQKITKNNLEEMIEIEKVLKEGRILFNSLGAGATLDCLHFHLHFYEFPIERTSEYPVKIKEFSINEKDRICAFIEKLEKKKIGFNLLISPSKVFVFPRRKEKAKVLVERKIGVAEVAGLWIIDKTLITEVLTEKIKELIFPLDSL